MTINVTLLLSMIDISPEFAAAWMNLGIVQASLNKSEVLCKLLCSSSDVSLVHFCTLSQEAESSYKQAIKHRKKYPDAYYNLGNLVHSSCIPINREVHV